MSLLLGAGMFFERRGQKLPYDAEVEYLESTGTQWIDTGMLLSGDCIIKLLGYFPRDTGNLALFGACNGAAYDNGEISIFFTGPSRPLSFTNVYPTSNTTSTLLPLASRPSYQADILSEIEYSKSGLIVNGVQYSVSWYADYQGTRPCALFAVNRSAGNGQYKSKIKVCRFSIYEDGGAGLDLLPVRFTNEHGVSEGAMYDRVSGQLFRNQGTDAFIIGPDKQEA